jgi:hypothetical protein
VIRVNTNFFLHCDGRMCRGLIFKWRIANCEWRVASGEWRVASGEWRVASGEWRLSEFSENSTNKEFKTKSVKSILRNYLLHSPFAVRRSPFF